MAQYWLKYGNSVLSKSGANIGITSADPHTVVIGGKIYPTVDMPDGNTWLARNLDLTWAGLVVNPQSLLSSDPIAAYYGRDETTYGWNGLQYGLLYNKAAVDYLIEHASTLFPGWHVQTELWNLYLTVGGTTYEPRTGAQALTTTTWWADGYNGNDTYGFALPPAGAAYVYGGSSSFAGLGTDAVQWSAEPYGDGYLTYSVYQNGMNGGYDTLGNGLRSIRLVKDSE